MMESIAQDFVKYVMHVQVVVEDQPERQRRHRHGATPAPTTRRRPAAAWPTAARAQAAAEGVEAAARPPRKRWSTPRS